MNRKDLQNLIALAEGFTAEFKRARTSGMTGADLGVKSIPRNPLLFGMLHRMEAVENIGSGIRRIYNLCRDYGVAEPKIAVSDNWFTVIFPRPQGEGDKTQIDAKGQVEGQVTSEGGQLAWYRSCPKSVPSDLVRRIMQASASPVDLLSLMSLAEQTNRSRFRKIILKPLTDANLLAPTIPDKPRSSKQRYRLTELGKEILKEQGKERH